MNKYFTSLKRNRLFYFTLVLSSLFFSLKAIAGDSTSRFTIGQFDDDVLSGNCYYINTASSIESSSPCTFYDQDLTTGDVDGLIVWENGNRMELRMGASSWSVNDKVTGDLDINSTGVYIWFNNRSEEFRFIF